MKDICAIADGIGPAVVGEEIGGVEGEAGEVFAAGRCEDFADGGFAGGGADGCADFVGGGEELVYEFEGDEAWLLLGILFLESVRARDAKGSYLCLPSLVR